MEEEEGKEQMIKKEEEEVGRRKRERLAHTDECWEEMTRQRARHVSWRLGS